MRPGQEKTRTIEVPECYEPEEAIEMIENTLNVNREFKVGCEWEDGNTLKICFAPHEQYAEDLTDDFIDEQMDYIEYLLS